MEQTDKHLIDMIRSYLKRENYQINIDDLGLQLLSNQSFPSVKSITDTLDYFGVKNIAVNIPKSALEQLPRHFMAVMHDRANAIVFVTRSGKGVKVFKTDGSSETLSQEDFCEQWTGTIIAIEGNTDKKTGFSVSLNNAQIPLALLVIGALLVNLVPFNLQGLIYTLLGTFGLIISYFLVQEDLGIYNGTTAKICNSTNANLSCDEVVKSKNAKLFNIFSLSDISIVYFTGILLLNSLLGFDHRFFLLLSLISLPFVLYSLYSQAFVLKKWCPLCLMVGAVLVAQFVASLNIPLTDLMPDLAFGLKGTIVLISAYLFWLYFKSLVQDHHDLKQTQTEYLKFKRSENLFPGLLAQHPRGASVLPDDTVKVAFGNPQAPLTFYTVTNPFCGHCTSTFEVFDQLLATRGDQFQLHLVFSVPSDQEQPSTQIAQRIIELYEKRPDRAYKALSDWYAKKKVKAWQSEFGLPEGDASFKRILENKEWCRTNNVQGTPTTFIGQYMYPTAYAIQDLLFLIDDLVEDNSVVLQPADHVLV